MPENRKKMGFKPGDEVHFLDEAGGGTVVKIEDDLVTVADADGFDFCHPAEKLVKPEWKGPKDVFPSRDLNGYAPTHKNTNRGYCLVGGKRPYMEVDLHSHMVMESERGLTAGDILQAQVDHFKRSLQTARDKRMGKVVFIHGVGRGVLREELRRLLDHMRMVEYGNADFRIYGGGATEVRLFYGDNTD